jgi:hypothetical protein
MPIISFMSVIYYKFTDASLPSELSNLYDNQYLPCTVAFFIACWMIYLIKNNDKFINKVLMLIHIVITTQAVASTIHNILPFNDNNDISIITLLLICVIYGAYLHKKSFKYIQGIIMIFVPIIYYDIMFSFVAF